LPIALNLPKSWSFERGFYVNTGIQFRGKNGAPHTYLWLDLKAARASAIDWSLFALCFILNGTDYSDPVPSLTFSDIARSMRKWSDIAKTRTSPLDVLIREQLFSDAASIPPTKKAKISNDTSAPSLDPEAAAEAILWNLRYWNIEYS
jgi:hypothetical protein